MALAIDGKRFSSTGFADFFEEKTVSGFSKIQFVIGGSLGLSEDVLKASSGKISFSDMTFPHQMMRVILLEQIRTIDKRRLKERIGKLDFEFMQRINTAISISFGLNDEP